MTPHQTSVAGHLTAAPAAVAGGSPADLRRRVWQLAWPSILANLAPAALGASDTAIIGHTAGAASLGAIALGGAIFGILYWGFGFLRMATTGFTAQAHGDGDGAEMRAAFARAAALALALGGVLILARRPLGDIALALVDGSPEVEALTRLFFDIVIWNAPAVLLFYGVVGWFIGMQDTRAAMAVTLFLIGVNIALNLVFVLAFGWQVQGVATGTLIAAWLAALVGVILVLRKTRGLAGGWEARLIFARRHWLRLTAVNRDIFIRTVALMVVYAFFTAQGARLGDVALAANAVLNNFIVLMAQTLDGFAHAVEALAGRAIGRRDGAELRRVFRLCLRLGVTVAAMFALAFAAAGDWIVVALTGLERVRGEASAILPWLVAAPLVSVWCFILDGLLVGATEGRAMRNGMLASLAVYFAAWALFMPLWGNHGLWFALQAFMAARALTLLPAYRRIMVQTP